MTLTRNEASAALAEIEKIAEQVKQSAIYRAASLILIAWGAIVAIGNLAEPILRASAPWCWIALNLAGVAVTLVLLAKLPRAQAAPLRMLTAFALFFAFGLAWSALLGKFGPRETDAFWPTLFLFGYALAGLVFGRAFTFIGVGLAALIFAGYIWVGAGYPFYLALVNGGGLMLCGYWMRRA